MAMEYARKRNFGFLEVSAKTGTNIKSAFTCLLRGNLKSLTNFRNIQKPKFARRSYTKKPRQKHQYKA